MIEWYKNVWFGVRLLRLRNLAPNHQAKSTIHSRNAFIPPQQRKCEHISRFQDFTSSQDPNQFTAIFQQIMILHCMNFCNEPLYKKGSIFSFTQWVPHTEGPLSPIVKTHPWHNQGPVIIHQKLVCLQEHKTYREKIKSGSPNPECKVLQVSKFIISQYLVSRL